MIPGKRSGELIDILVTENTPEAIAGSKLRGRCFEEEANIGEFVFEAREEGGKGLFVLGEILVAKTLVMIYFADLAELKLTFLLLPCACFRLLVLRLLPHYRLIDSQINFLSRYCFLRGLCIDYYYY